VSALEDRRQNALEAYFDDDNSVMSAIESATRVEITEDIIEAALDAVSAGNGARPRYVNAIIAAFRAAGFEVVT
jgi:hypothetical protein